jgi:4-amino-4-deoxychorismate lyase
MGMLFPEASPVNLGMIPIPDHARTGIVKCRIVYDREIQTIDFLPYFPKAILSLKLVRAESLEYQFKYLDRSVIEQLLADHKDYDEIILVKNGCITDSSYSNLAFRAGEDWYTPDEPLLRGTCRQRLIEAGILHPVKIRPEDVYQYSHVSLINAMLDLEDMTLPIQSIKS